MTNNEPFFSVDNNESLVSLDFNPIESNTDLTFSEPQNVCSDVQASSKDTLIQASAETQDTTKPYRIVFRGELVHD
ncbi:MAG: hypothetical protein IJN67_08075 [Oscillospiraceae bacterium]|nr:hypothetical protein [Oscillospiraceae bacterium]